MPYFKTNQEILCLLVMKPARTEAGRAVAQKLIERLSAAIEAAK